MEHLVNYVFQCSLLYVLIIIIKMRLHFQLFYLWNPLSITNWLIKDPNISMIFTANVCSLVFSRIFYKNEIWHDIYLVLLSQWKCMCWELPHNKVANILLQFSAYWCQLMNSINFRHFSVTTANRYVTLMFQGGVVFWVNSVGIDILYTKPKKKKCVSRAFFWEKAIFCFIVTLSTFFWHFSSKQIGIFSAKFHRKMLIFVS